MTINSAWEKLKNLCRKLTAADALTKNQFNNNALILLLI